MSVSKSNSFMKKERGTPSALQTNVPAPSNTHCTNLLAPTLVRFIVSPSMCSDT